MATKTRPYMGLLNSVYYVKVLRCDNRITGLWIHADAATLYLSADEFENVREFKAAYFHAFNRLIDISKKELIVAINALLDKYNTEQNKMLEEHFEREKAEEVRKCRESQPVKKLDDVWWGHVPQKGARIRAKGKSNSERGYE